MFQTAMLNPRWRRDSLVDCPVDLVNGGDKDEFVEMANLTAGADGFADGPPDR